MDLDFHDSEYFTHVLSVNGKLLEVPLRRGRSDAAFIDYLTFTVGKSTFKSFIDERYICLTEPDDEVYIYFISKVLETVFGFGITEKCKGKGKFFYQSYYRLGLEKCNYGTVHIGGQRDTVLIDLSAVGCQAALPGWEKRLYEFSCSADRFGISRVDAAYDFFNGEYNVQKALQQYRKGGFDVKGMRPKYKLDGLDWFNKDDSGKTVYIGRRGSSKFCRVYEKGKQLGDPQSLWVRFEIEFRKNDCLIPNDILLSPGSYLSGAYPIGKDLFKTGAKRAVAANRKVKTVLAEKIHYARNQVGKLVRYLSDMGWEAQDIVNALIAPQGEYPKGLAFSEYDCKSECINYIHHKEPEFESVFSDADFLSSFVEQLKKNCSDKTVLQQFDEDVEYWQWFASIVAYAKSPKIARAYERQLFDDLFIKYTEFAYPQL